MNKDEIKKLNKLELEDVSELSEKEVLKLINNSEKLKELLKKAFPKRDIDSDDFDSLYLNDNTNKIITTYLFYNGYNIIEKNLIEEDYQEETNDAILNNSTSLYFKEIGKIKLLTADEEKKLFEEYKKTKNPLIKKKIADANLRLVASIAKKYNDKTLTILDLCQEGNLGLLEAIDRFNVDLGYRFSTYATSWIRQSITRAIANKSRTIRIPVHLTGTINKMNRISNKIVKERGYEPSPSELSETMGIKEEKIKELMTYFDATSLDRNIKEESDSEDLYNFIPDKTSVEDEVLNSIFNEELSNGIENVLKILNRDERLVITLRYGITDGRKRTLNEIGKIMGVSRERIRQIEDRALKKLRHPRNTKKIKYYLE